jgi:16S rRNA (cytosine967-C5)-methyltransferase
MVKLTRQEKLMTKISPARAAALEVLTDETDNYRARLDAALNNIADPRDRGLATALANGVTRWKRRLDYIISKLIERPLEKLEKPVHAAMRMAIYQMTLMDKVPDHTAVNEAVQIARDNCGQGAGKQTNAVLRRFQREMDELTWPDKEKEAAKYLSIYYSHPLWMVRRWLARFGFEETEELLIRNNEPAPTTLRVNRRWVTREALQNFLEMRGVMATPTEISEWGLNVIGGGDPRTTEEYKEGLYTVQTRPKSRRMGHGRRCGWQDYPSGGMG